MDQIYMTRQRRPTAQRGAEDLPASTMEALPNRTQNAAWESSLNAIQEVRPHEGRRLSLDAAMSSRMQEQFGIRMDQVELRESSQPADMDAKAFAKAREITRLSMVNAAALEELLHTHAGAVGVMELMYDMEGKLELFLDRELLGWEYLRFPPNADGALLRVRTADFLEKILPAVGHGYTALEEDDACFGLPEAEFQFRPLRRSRQALPREEEAAILSRHTHGVLALAGDGGYPYAVPMSYAYRDGKLYFHSARAGHKIDSLTRSAKVSFCVVDADEVVPEEYTTYFRSAIAFGKARVLTDPAEMRKGLELLGERYWPGHPVELAAEIEKEFAAVAVIEMEIEHLSGKEAIELVNKREKK